MEGRGDRIKLAESVQFLAIDAEECRCRVLRPKIESAEVEDGKIVLKLALSIMGVDAPAEEVVTLGKSDLILIVVRPRQSSNAPSAKLCMFCGVEMKPVIATPNEIYGADAPFGNTRVPTGDYYCPRCRAGNCGISIPPTLEEIENLKRWFHHNPQDLERCIPIVRGLFEIGALGALGRV
jgi:hypothetical protein